MRGLEFGARRNGGGCRRREGREPCHRLGER